ncbi:nickel ABC transporter permease [Alkalihalobacillus sp. FSL R5-0424]
MSMYIMKRILMIVPIFLIATFVTYGMISLSPVDPAEAYFAAAHIQATDQMIEDKRAELGLDQHFVVQYLESLKRISQLDFGLSYLTDKPVFQEITSRMSATIQLSISSLLIAIVVSVPIGFFAGMKKNSLIDHLSRALSFIGASIPSFWLGYLLIFFLSVKFDLFPVEGTGSWQHLVLPSLTLAFPLIAVYTRLLRTSVMDNLKEPYVLFARTRGLREKLIIGKHLFRMSISPMIAGLGMNLGNLMTGAIIVEVVFSWPGFGRYFIDALFNRDIPVIQGYVVLASAIFLLANLLVDLLQMMIDPRIARVRGGSK